MKKFLVLFLTLFLTSFLFANVLDIFHPPVSYSEIATLGSKEILGPFSFDQLPYDMQGNERDPNYFFYGERRYGGFYFPFSSPSAAVINGSDYIKHYYQNDSMRVDALFAFPFNEDGSLYKDYYVLEENENRVLYTRSSSSDIKIEYKDFGDFQRKIVYVADTPIFCHWIYSCIEIDGIKFPTRECFYFSDGPNKGQILYKKTVKMGKRGGDYSPFTLEHLKEYEQLVTENK